MPIELRSVRRSPRALHRQIADQLEAETTPEAFESCFRMLHQQHLASEFSFGRFSELAGVAHLELREILDALGLALTN